jgi:hypothetical protein
MKLQDLAKQILREDTWGNNPSAAGSMSPGRSPTAKSPNAAYYNPRPEVEKLISNVEKAESGEEKKLDNSVTQKLTGKNVTVKASKGSVGQTEQEYTIDVSSVEVNNLNDVFYIVLKGTERGNGKESDYYINTNFQVKINAASAPEDKENPADAQPEQPQQQQAGQSKLKNVGGMVSTKPLNSHPARNIVPQG